MQHARRAAMGTLVLAMATSGVALAAGDPEQDRDARGVEPPAGAATRAAPRDTTIRAAATEGEHHASAPAPASPTAAEADAELSRAAGSSADGTDWGARLGRGEVERVQRELSSRGIYRGPIDGRVGPKTLAALQSFQAQQGLPAHARLDTQTRRALGMGPNLQPVSGDEASSAPGLLPSVGRETAEAGGRSASAPMKLDTFDAQQLTALQTRLSELGFYRGSVDGKLGAGTRSALQRFFQAQAELASRGMLTEGAATWLGLEPQQTLAPNASSEPPATMPHPQPSTP